jgi:putative component of membrane protein insertase Oxa1/YidC/SpoIIIJ protein YidD
MPDMLAIQTMPSRAAAACIELYQQHLSPRKGFACAHRIVHGGSSCSEFARRAVLQHGAVRVVPLLRARFRACAEAAQTRRTRSMLDYQSKAPSAEQTEAPKIQREPCPCCESPSNDCFTEFAVRGCLEVICSAW